MIALTRNTIAHIMLVPLPHAAVGISPPHKGAKTPLSNVVFLYPSIMQAQPMRECLFFMVGCIRQPVKRLVASFGDRTNLIQSAAKSLVPLDGGLSLIKGIAMSQNQSALNPTVTPVFNLFAYRQPIAQGICGALALRFKRRYPTCTVKFSGFEVAA